MTPDADEDAFRWDGDEDADAPGSRGRQSRNAKGASTHGATAGGDRPPGLRSGSTEPAGDTADAEGEQAMSSVLLVVLGVLGGIYLLYTVGWAVTAVRHAGAVAQGGMQIAGEVERWMATVASPLWFFAVLYLSRGHRTARVIWLIAGALILAPWPFIMGGI